MRIEMTLSYRAAKISSGGKVLLAPESEPTAVMYVPDEVLNRAIAKTKNTKLKAAAKLAGGERAKALRAEQTDLFKLVDSTVGKVLNSTFA